MSVNSLPKKYCVLVDAYSAGSVLPEYFSSRGFTCLHVRSLEELPEYYLRSKPNEALIEKTFIYRGNLEEILQDLRSFNPQFILAGAEIGVQLADRLSEQLKLKGNGTEKSECRRNKYLMSEALRVAGLTTVEQAVTSSVDFAQSWAKDLGRWPIVIKPVDSSLADGFNIAKSHEDISMAFDALMSKRSAVGQINRQVLVQEYLDGVEYMVNTVSWNGVHHVTDIWKSKKRVTGNTKIYDFEDLVSGEDELFHFLSSYIRGVLDALRVQYGPAHSEVMRTSLGFKLIETGARLCGGLPSSVGTLCHGLSQIELTVKAYAEQEMPFDQLCMGWTPKPIKHSRCITLIAPFSGTVADEPDFSDLRNLASFHSLSTSLARGGRFNKTIDLSSTPGIIFLVHQSQEQIERDYEFIRRAELDGLYKWVKQEL